MSYFMPPVMDGLVIQKIGDESVIVPSGRQDALSLDAASTVVLGLCDGETSREEAARALSALWRLDPCEALAKLEDRLSWLDEHGLLAPRNMPSVAAQLVVSDPLGGELVVVAAEQAYLLNPVVATIFAACDGQTPVNEVALRLAGSETDPQAAEQAVWMGLERLRQHGLLAPTAGLPRATTRRAFMKRWAAAAALLPLITSLSLPKPAAAISATCVGFGTSGCATAFGVLARISTCVQCCTPSCPCAAGFFCMTIYSSHAGTSCLDDPVLQVICNLDNGPGTGVQQSCVGARGASVGQYKCCQCP